MSKFPVRTNFLVVACLAFAATASVYAQAKPGAIDKAQRL